VLFETSSGNAELIKEFAASAPYPIGDSAMAALYQAGMQNTDFTAFRDAFVGLNFGFIDGVAWYHNSVDTVARLDPASLQHMARTCWVSPVGWGNAILRSCVLSMTRSSSAPLDIWWPIRCGWSGRWLDLR
jgi:hypothetical protein